MRKRSPARLNSVKFFLTLILRRTMIATEQILENLTLTIGQQIHVLAPWM